MTASLSTFGHNSVILGTGGESPGVVSIQAETHECSTLLPLRKGQSVYTLDLDLAGNSIAAGTRSGEVYLIKNLSPPSTSEDIQFQQYLQSAPVMSVRITGQQALISTDTLGRCLLWNPDDPGSPPRHLETEKSVIVSLTCISGQQVAGLTTEGTLFIWNIPSGDLVSRAAGPKPPMKGALIKLTCWYAAETITYPSCGGNLTQYSLSNGQLISHTAHTGDFYAIQTWGDYLVTAGMDDSLFRVWRGRKESPELEFIIPKGIVSIAGIGTQPDTFLLIDQNGRIMLASFQKDHLETVNHLNNHVVRCAVGPTYEQLSRCQEQSREREAKRISQEIHSKASASPVGTLEPLHARLVELGYEHVSLLHRTEEAAHQGDIVQELKYRERLLRLIPMDHSSSVSLLTKHANLLRKVCRFQEAYEVYDRIIKIEPSPENLLQLEEMQKWVNIHQSGQYIIDTDLPLQSRAKVADASGQPLTGTFLLRRLDTLTCRGTIVTGESLIRKYEQIQKERPHQRLPFPYLNQVHLFSLSNPHHGEYVLFGKNGESHPHGLRFALQLHNDGIQTVVTPLVLLEIPPPSAAKSHTEHNHDVMQNLNEIYNSDLSRSWLTNVFDCIKSALRRTIAESRAIENTQKDLG